jgi:hypothetical protein
LLNTGVVEGEVKSAKSFHRLVQCRLHIRGARYVTRDCQRAPTARFDEGGSFAVAFLGDVGNSDIGTCRGERQRRSATDPLAAPVTKATFPANSPLLLGITHFPSDVH